MCLVISNDYYPLGSNAVYVSLLNTVTSIKQSTKYNTKYWESLAGDKFGELRESSMTHQTTTKSIKISAYNYNLLADLLTRQTFFPNAQKE